MILIWVISSSSSNEKLLGFSINFIVVLVIDVLSMLLRMPLSRRPFNISHVYNASRAGHFSAGKALCLTETQTMFCQERSGRYSRGACASLPFLIYPHVLSLTVEPLFGTNENTRDLQCKPCCKMYDLSRKSGDTREKRDYEERHDDFAENIFTANAGLFLFSPCYLCVLCL